MMGVDPIRQKIKYPMNHNSDDPSAHSIVLKDRVSRDRRGARTDRSDSWWGALAITYVERNVAIICGDCDQKRHDFFHLLLKSFVGLTLM